WIIMLAAAMLISIFGLKRTKKGYKFPVSRIVGGNVIFSIMLGTLFFLGGGAQWFENAFDVNVGFYEGVEEKKIKMWSLPEEGYLSGTISQVKGSTIVIVDNHKQTWEVDIEDAKIFTLVELTIGERVKLIGTVVTDTFFDASEVRPWGGFGRGGSRHGKNQGQNE
ncbi:MAG TPA: hypothetical protein VK994_02420, partial [Bacteroidales bacterium]|nr:hypothetical protein [Bacteroidales bacterium]